MKIHIITGHFHPQIHPRAFRARELALEFACRGHNVTVSNCWTIKNFDYQKYSSDNSIKINNIGLFETELSDAGVNVGKKTWLKSKMNFLKEYLFAGSVLFRARTLASRLEIDEDTDMIISLSTPFTCLLGLSRYLKKSQKQFFAVGDSGDPFYYSKQVSKAPWFKPLERDVYKQFDYLCIPTENAISLYSPLLPIEKIKIIPQGFRMDNLKLYDGVFGNPIKFAYAGVFYWDIRNPTFLFEYLNTLHIDFKFHLYMRAADSRIEELLKDKPELKKKISVQSLPHDELIYELSKMDFLINIENVSNTQMPSKLIDYGMSGRPIYSCKKETFSTDIFNDFLNRKYDKKYQIDIEQYDIRNIADQFLALKNENRTNYMR